MTKTLAELLEEIKSLPPNERIVKLLDLKKKVKESIEKRQKELEDAEKTAVVAVVEEKKEEERKKEEEFLIKEVPSAVKPAPEEEISLEEMVAAEKKPAAESPANYGKIIDEIKTTLYEAAPAIYRGMQELRNRASEGNLSREDRRRFESYNEMMDQITKIMPGYVSNSEARENLLKMQYAMRQTEQYSSDKTQGGY